MSLVKQLRTLAASYKHPRLWAAPYSFATAKASVKDLMRKQAAQGHSWARIMTSTDPFGGPCCGYLYMGTSGNADWDEFVAKKIVAWLHQEEISASCHRQDTPERYDSWYHETEKAYSECFIEIGWGEKK